MVHALFEFIGLKKKVQEFQGARIQVKSEKMKISGYGFWLFIRRWTLDVECWTFIFRTTPMVFRGRGPESHEQNHRNFRKQKLYRRAKLESLSMEGLF
jgi:hypothetical protein